MAGTTQGPIDRDGLVALFRKGTLTPQVEVSDGGDAWSIAPQVPGLMEEVFGSNENAPEPPKGDPGSRFATAPNSKSSQNSSRSGMSSDLAGPASGTPRQSPAPAPQAPAPGPATNQPTTPTPAPAQNPTAEDQPSLGALVKSGDASESDADQPSGPVGHIVLDASGQRRRRSGSSELEFLQTATCGM
ncbi:MAG: hypothetical protein ACR2RV_06710, partial [Verrucomicrobiales bacterium]